MHAPCGSGRPERVTAEILKSGTELVVVSTSGFGTDNIDIPAATERGILVVNHQGFGRVPVSEHTIMMMLAAAKQLVWGDRGVRDGSAWSNRSGLQISELEGKTVGIIGLGYIGSEIARKLKYGFNCRVLAYDPHVNPRIARLVDAQLVKDLHTMLPECQFLVLVPELTPEARGMIGAKELAALPKGAIVVNTGRGQVLDFDALNDAWKVIISLRQRSTPISQSRCLRTIHCCEIRKRRCRLTSPAQPSRHRFSLRVPLQTRS